MSVLTLSKEDVLAKAGEEYEKKRLLEEEELKSRREFASRVLTGLRYPETVPFHQEGDYAKAYDAMEDHEISHLTLLRKQYGPSIRSIILSPGKETKDLGHFAISYAPETQLTAIYDFIDTKAPFAHTLVVPIEGIEESDLNEIRKQYAEIMRSHLAQYPSESPSVFTHMSLESGSYRDSKEWATFLPSSKASVGIYCNDGKFYIVASSHAGEAAVDDLKTIMANERPTIQALASDPRLKWIQKMSHRNCGRLAFELASRLGLRVPYKKDHNVCFHPHKKQPLLGHSSVFTVHNTVGRDIDNNVVCYHGCSDPRQGSGSMLLRSNLYHGLVHVKPSKLQPCNIHLHPVFTSRVHKKQRRCFKPTMHKKIKKRIHYSKESKYGKTAFSRETYHSGFFARVSSFFGLPEHSSQTLAPVFVYSS